MSVDSSEPEQMPGQRPRRGRIRQRNSRAYGQGTSVVELYSPCHHFACGSGVAPFCQCEIGALRCDLIRQIRCDHLERIIIKLYNTRPEPQCG